MQYFLIASCSNSIVFILVEKISSKKVCEKIAFNRNVGFYG